jgi:hypothetical protein
LAERTEILAGLNPPDFPSLKISRFDAQATRPYSLDLVIRGNARQPADPDCESGGLAEVDP